MALYINILLNNLLEYKLKNASITLIHFMLFWKGTLAHCKNYALIGVIFICFKALIWLRLIRKNGLMSGRFFCYINSTY